MIRLFLAFLLLRPPVGLHAASFDCSKAHTSVERAICSSPELSAADDKLDRTYRTSLTKVPEAAVLVREAQRKWLQSVEQNCTADENHPIANCLAAEWESRTLFLSHIVVRMGGVPFFFRKTSLKMTGNNENKQTGNAKSIPQPGDSADADSDHALGTFYAAWPEAISNEPQWEAWNKASLDETRRFNASQDTGDAVPDHWVLFPDPTWHSDLEISVDLNWVSTTLAATTINRDYTYAHPAHQERAFNAKWWAPLPARSARRPGDQVGKFS